jgi:NADPH2:quinone reductase
MGGSLARYASNGDREPRVAAAMVMQKNPAIHGMVLPSVPHEARRHAHSDIARFIAVPRRMLSVAAMLLLAGSALAHERVEAGGKVGTVVVKTAK